MADYKDTRSIYAKREETTRIEPAAPEVDAWTILKPVTIGLLRWLSLVCAIALGCRIALLWWSHDEAESMRRTINSFSPPSVFRR